MQRCVWIGVVQDSSKKIANQQHKYETVTTDVRGDEKSHLSTWRLESEDSIARRLGWQPDTTLPATLLQKNNCAHGPQADFAVYLPATSIPKLALIVPRSIGYNRRQRQYKARQRM